MSLIIKQVSNGFLVGVEGERFEQMTVVLSVDELLCEVRDHFDPEPTVEQDLPSAEDVCGILAEQPQDTDSTESMVEPEPIEPLTDLTGVDYAPAFEGYQPNGALPETD